MSVFLRHEACPKCRARGEDKKGNNLGRYADGSAWCFAGHGLVERANRIPVVDKQHLEVDDDAVQLDDDLCFDYPRHVVEWLAKYGISVPEAIKHGWKYGPKRDQLVFIFADQEGNISCTQARNFWSGAKVKYFTQGSVAETLPIFHSSVDSRKLAIVEDAVSAAKIARQCDAMPCLGSHLPKNKINALRLLGYEQLVFWLDENKLTESRAMAQAAKWIGFETKVVYTPLDPKEYDDSTIAGSL